MKNRLPIPMRLLVLIFILGLFVSAISVMFYSQHPSLHWDAAHYTVLARNLAAGNGFVNEPGRPTAYRTPLYPALLSVFFRVIGERYMAVWCFQAMLSALTAAATAWLAFRIAGRRAMMITGVLAAMNPSSARMTGMLLTEIVFAFLIVTSLIMLYLALRRSAECGMLPYYGGFAMAGISMGVAALCRPNTIIWAFLACGYILVRKGGRIPVRLAASFILLAGVALPVAPWMARNQTSMGTTSLATTGGRTFWEFRHRDVETESDRGVPPPEFAEANEMADQRAMAEEGGDPGRLVPVFNICPRYHAFFHDQETIDRFTGLSEGEADRLYYRMGIEYTLSNPLKVFLESCMDTLKIFSPLDRTGRVNPVLFIALPFILVGFLRVWNLNREAGAAVITGLLSMAVVSFLVPYEPRYRIPYEPLMLLAAGVGMDTILKNGTKGRAGVLLAVGYLIFTAAAWATLHGPTTT